MNAYCTNCGNQLKEGVRFCTHCGKPVSNSNPPPSYIEYQEANKTENTPSEKVNIEQKQFGTVNTSVPPTEFKGLSSKRSQQVSTRKILLIVLVIIIAALGYGGYYIFLEHHPDVDGKKAAELMCNFNKEEQKNHVLKYNEFNTNFYKYGFKTRAEAQQKLDELVNTRDPYLVTIYTRAFGEYNRLRSYYVNDPAALIIFDQVYNGNTASAFCSAGKEAEISIGLMNANNKINAIREQGNELNSLQTILTVKSERAYFYNSPYGSKEKIYVVKGDRISDIEEKNGFVFTVFTGASGKTVNGWISRDELEASTEDETNHTEQVTALPANIRGKYPQASIRILFSNEISTMNKYDLKIMRNEIFARHGYIFKTPDMHYYFAHQDWYRASNENVDGLLSAVEKQNIELIKKYE